MTRERSARGDLGDLAARRLDHRHRLSLELSSELVPWPAGSSSLTLTLHSGLISPQGTGPSNRVNLNFDRRVAEGKTTKEAIRALKRQLSNTVYRHLVADTRRH